MRLLPKDRDLNERLERIELRVDASDLRVRVDEVHVRLDVYLSGRLQWRSRSSIQNLIRDGQVLVDASSPEHPRGTGEARIELRPGRRLAHGSRIVIVIPEGARFTSVSPPSEELCVLHEDESALVVDKPPFVAVHPSGRYLSDTLIQRVLAHFHCERLHRDARPRLCHRLDRETSGLVLIGKDPEAHAALMRQFERREVEKEYLAIVQGSPEQERGRIELPIGPSRVSDVELKMAVLPDGQPASTEWNVVSRHASCALLACRPFTGRQHQIRVHLEAIGHPLVGDKLYGCDEKLFQKHADGELDARDLRRLELPRHALHNHRLVFTSPRSGARVEVHSPLAPDLAAFLATR